MMLSQKKDMLRKETKKVKGVVFGRVREEKKQKGTLKGTFETISCLVDLKRESKKGRKKERKQK